MDWPLRQFYFELRHNRRQQRDDMLIYLTGKRYLVYAINTKAKTQDVCQCRNKSSADNVFQSNVEGRGVQYIPVS